MAMVGSKLMHSHKVKATEAIIKNVRMAVEEFAQANPLGSVYDRKDLKSFGPLPPYKLDAWDTAAEGLSVQRVLEPNAAYGPYNHTLGDRFHRDFGNRSGNVADYASWGQFDPNDGNDDIRALYTYLKLYAPDALSSLPKDALKPLGTSSEFVNPTGAGFGLGANGMVDVLGIHDAWGVPLNYFVYVKLEWTLSPTSGAGIWVVTDRIPVVMSHGHEKEVHEAEPAGAEHELEQWILSDAFPSPVALGVDRVTGALPAPGSSQYAGWARAKAAGEEYDYIP